MSGQPQVPDTPWTRLEAAIGDYLDGYELRDCENEDGITGDYSPSEIELVLIEDAINGLFADEDLLDLIVEARAYTRETRRAEGRCETCGHPNDGEHWGNRCQAQNAAATLQSAPSDAAGSGNTGGS